MPNPILSWLKGDHLPRRTLEQKFSPATQTPIPGGWERVNSLVMNFDQDTSAHKGDGNSAVFACLMALSMGAIEAPLRVYKRDAKGEFEPVDTHPLQLFLDDPNPELDMLELRFWLNWARHIDGNAYLLKVRSGNATSGNPVQLWPISPLVMTPWNDKGSQKFIDSYRLETRPGIFEYHPIENVIHFKLGVDDMDHRKGLAPLKRLIREIASDAEATKFADALLRNFGVPGLVVTTPANADISPEAAVDLKTKIANSFGNDNRGNVGILTAGADMKQFGFTPDQLNMTILHNIPESRICAVMGVHPAVAGLHVGLMQSANFASLNAIFEAFTERKLVPLWKMDESKWTKRLARDFDQNPRIVVKHDLGDVRSLQEDENALWARLGAAADAGRISLQEFRSAVGMSPDINPDDIFMVASTSTPTPGSEILNPPEPEPMPAALPPGTPDDAQPQPALAAPTKMLDLKSFDLEDWPELMAGIIELAAPSFTEDLDKLFDNQRRRIKKNMLRLG